MAIKGKDKYPVATEAAYWDENEESKKPLIGGIRIAKVTYEHHPIRQSEHGTSIGGMIDDHIRTIVKDGGLVGEVSVFFETAEQQEAVAELYRAERRNY